MKTELKTKPAKTVSKNKPAAVTKAEKNIAAAKALNFDDKKTLAAMAVERKASSKTHVFALVAGAVAKIEHKFLKQAVSYHVSKGSLKKTEAGVVLTEQGKTLWDKERVAKDPAMFQEIAAWMHGKGPLPAQFANTQLPPTAVNTTVAFPNIVYWGSFSGAPMRAAFAAIWAK